MASSDNCAGKCECAVGMVVGTSYGEHCAMANDRF